MRVVGVGVIGFGLGARVFHCPFISAVPGLRLCAVVVRNPAADSGLEAYPETAALRSVDELLERPEIELVVVTTPNATHFDLARRALEAGRHVVIDKPFASTAAEARELIELAQEMGLVVVPFHNRRFDGDFLTLRAVLDSGALGRVVTVESHFDRFRPLPRENTWKETGNPANGLLMDLAPHLVDQALALSGLPRTVTASIRTDRTRSAIEDAFDIVLGYDGLRYWCRSSMLACEAAPRFLVHGTQGSFRKYGVDPQEPALVGGARVPVLGSPKDSTEVWLAEPPAAWGTLTVAPVPAEPGTLERTTIETRPGDYRLFYAGVRDTLLHGAEPPVPAEAGYDVVRLLELARESSRQGRTLDVEARDAPMTVRPGFTVG